MMNINIPEEVKMYLAGLFAGDGNVSVVKSRNGARTRTRLGFVYKPVLNNILHILNAGSILAIKKSENDIKNFHKQKWVWILDSNDAVQFLEMILPYLPEKYEQSKLAIKFNTWQKKYMRSGNNITQDQMMYCEKVIKESKMLKEQIVTIKDVKKYDLFKKKHYNVDIESGKQSVLGGFNDDFFIKKDTNDNEAKNIISPDINLDIIESMTDPGFTGFFDAEGSVSIQKRYCKNDIYTLSVSIENSNFSILDKYHKVFGGSIGDPIINKDRKIRWLWAISASSALNFLEHICSYSLEKREQIELAIEFMNRRNDKTLTYERSKYIYEKIKELKHIEYPINGKTRIVPYGSMEILKKMKNDNTLIEIEINFHKSIMNDKSFSYDSSYFNNNYCGKDNFNNINNQNDLGF